LLQATVDSTATLHLSMSPTKRPTPQGGRPASQRSQQPKAKSRQQQREIEQRAARRRRWIWGGGIVGVAAAASVLFLVLRGGSSPTPTPAPGADITQLASIDGEASGDPVDGISCDAQEQVAFHNHAHLSVFVDGKARTIPQGIGIAAPRSEQPDATSPFVVSGKCFYWLHGHTNDGVIHIEAPAQRAFTLGEYFDVWKQPLDGNHVGPVTGQLTVYVDQKPYTGDPRAIPLGPHTQIQINVGTNVSPAPYSFPSGS